MKLRGGAAGVLGLVLASAALVGCSGDAPAEEEPAAEESSASSAPSIEVPEGVALTEQGSELTYGDTAEVAWRPREGVTGALDLTVTQVRQVSIDEFSAFRIGPAVRSSTPYFVRAQVENVGADDLGGIGVPLYLLDDSDTLIERSTFGSSFDACPSEPLPEPFEPGDTRRTCLVFLVPEGGEAAAVSFRPTEEFSPITWTGEIETPQEQRPGRQGRQGRQAGQQGQGQQGQGQQGRGQGN